MNATDIAMLMGDAVTQVLWPQRQLFMKARAGKPIECKAGAGQATYFRAGRRADTIVFGKKMVVSKCDTDATAWLSTRELCKYGYFDGHISPLNLLAHTVCHEYAHYLQAHFKQRPKGSIHNGAFYGHLAALYEHGLALQVRDYIAQRQPELALMVSPVALEASSNTQLLLNTPRPTLRPGDALVFDNRGQLTRAVVIRVNRKTVSAKAKGARGAYWRIPFHLLR